MEVPLNAQVDCLDGEFGRSMCVLVDPVIDKVTDVVVQANLPPHTEYIVPLGYVKETIANRIQLRCSKAEMQTMDLFYKTAFIEEKVTELSYGINSGYFGMTSLYYMPYTTPEVSMQVEVNIPQIPMGELSVRRGTPVQASDGYVGKVDEFVVNKENSHITHLVMREGHLWGKKDVIIPLSAIKKMGAALGDAVLLNLDKHQIESLPTFPLHRRWS